MNAPEEEFLRTLRATFAVEANEHLQVMWTGLLALEKTPAPDDRRRFIETVFRAAHSLKGAARAVNLRGIESICQSLEELFAAWKRQENAPLTAALDTAHRALDAVAAALAAPKEESSSHTIIARQDFATASGAHDTAPGAESVRIGVAKLDARLLEAEEMLAAKVVTRQHAADLRELTGRFETWTKKWASVQPDVRRLRQFFEREVHESTIPKCVTQVLKFVDWNHDYLRLLENQTTALCGTAEQDRLVVGKLVDDLLEDSKKLLMLPLATLGALFPKVVRDLCHDQGKEADLAIHGAEIEIDKRILEEMKDPIVHLLRNCVDHGIETPEQRRRLGKSPRATVTISVAAVNGNKVEIRVSDDGGGINVAKLKESAIRRGLLTVDAAAVIAESDALTLIFEPDISTSPTVTEVSGRGLGLAIVREKTEKLGGRVAVESRRDSGTTICMTLPLALATFRGVLIEVSRRLFVVPTAQVERVTRFRAQDIQTIENRETLILDGRAVALARLSEVLKLFASPPDAASTAMTSAIILGAGEQRVAFAVDTVLDEQEVLVKRFRKPLVRVRHVAGATVLGSGQVVPILNVIDLLKSARHAGAPMRMAAITKPTVAKAKAILVVEDSITSRLLLKGILESAGYRVKTAVDGLEAFATLRTESFDLVVSDVEMPRLNGFDLTARIRADRKLAELPVVLVTALETREDRERGVNVGASAYIIKSSFDQSNLLEAVRRLA